MTQIARRPVRSILDAHLDNLNARRDESCDNAM